MSAWEAVLLSSIAFGSMWACYCLGFRDGRMTERRRQERYYRREEFGSDWDNYEDFDD
jgi:hypothetical protein